MYYKDFWYTQTSKYFVAKTTKLTDDFGFMHVFSSRHFVATKFILCKSRSELNISMSQNFRSGNSFKVCSTSNPHVKRILVPEKRCVMRKLAVLFS